MVERWVEGIERGLEGIEKWIEGDGERVTTILEPMTVS